LVLPMTTTDTILYVTVNGDQVPVYISIPTDCPQKALPAVVLLHGSGGMWQDDDRDAGVMSRQNREWRALFDANCFVGVYIDSYTPRGCVERAGDWATAPKEFLISSEFVRPYDAYAAMSLLKTLSWPNGIRIVNSEKIGILGFSDGATSLLATLYDTDKTPEGWQWTQKYDKEYTSADGIKPPAARPEEGGFACGVFYYGGSVGNSYWGGNPCTNQNFMYENYAPILYQIPADGYLTENTLCAFAHLESIDAPVTKYIYDGSGHGFDADGTTVANSELARTRSIDWFKKYFNK
jgi:dienelactone hydrolase